MYPEHPSSSHSKRGRESNNSPPIQISADYRYLSDAISTNLNSPKEQSLKRSQPSAETSREQDDSSDNQSSDECEVVSWPANAVPALHHEVLTCEADVNTLLRNRRDDSTVVFIAVAGWAAPHWQTCLGDEDAQRALAANAVVDAYFVDVDALGAAAELLGITLSALPSAHSFHHDPTGDGVRAVKRGQKELHAPVDLVSLLCLQPVFGVAHLHRRLDVATVPSAPEIHTKFLIVYSGAVWCPPCCRIMPNIPAMIADLNAELREKGAEVALVKADRDTSGTIDAVYNVKLIPTFQVFCVGDAPCGLSAVDAIACLPVTAPSHHDEEDANDADAESKARWAEQLAEARLVVVKPVDALQNSQVGNVRAFLQRHCTPVISPVLSFDEDF